MTAKTLKVTQIKSTAGRLRKQKACVAGLGLRRIGHTVEVEDTPSIRGMINKVNFLLAVESGAIEGSSNQSDKGNEGQDNEGQEG